MYKLTATYEIELAHSIRVKRAQDDEPHYLATIDGFEVEIHLLPNGASFKERGDEFDTRGITRVRVSVSRAEGSAPPDIVRTKDGNRVFSERVAWFGKIGTAEYGTVAVKALNRMASFCRYELKIPNVSEFQVHDNRFSNPIWSGEDGCKLDSGILELTVTTVSPRGPRLLGEMDFTPDFDGILRRALQHDAVIAVHREFLADAQTSIVNGKLERAILELALACEIAVKQKFSRAITIKSKGAYYRFVDRKECTRVSVAEIIHVVAKAESGASFKDETKDAYQHIDFLFRCRNTVAHRGELRYTDDSSREHSVNRLTFEAWWVSVEKLMVWLAEQDSD